PPRFSCLFTLWGQAGLSTCPTAHRGSDVYLRYGAGGPFNLPDCPLRVCCFIYAMGAGGPLASAPCLLSVVIFSNVQVTRLSNGRRRTGQSDLLQIGHEYSMQGST